MEKARNALLSQLAGYKKIMPHDITVVFDSYRTGPARRQISYHGGVRVIYTGLGEKADDVIKQTVSQERREWAVVSADREIVDHAWANGSAPVSPEKFMDIICRRCRTGADEDAATEEEDERDGNCGRQYRGNPFQPSRKERLLRKVLSKL
jgi:predicted RNA-binding protein with PIN domain